MPPRMPTTQVGDSPRARLAQLALDAALDVAGVQEADSGPNGLCLTSAPPAGTLRGVSVIAQSDERYSIDLCLVAGMVPLIELAAEVRRRVQARAAREGLEGRLGEVNVQFSAVLSAAEIAERAARELAAHAVVQAVGSPRPEGPDVAGTPGAGSSASPSQLEERLP